MLSATKVCFRISSRFAVLFCFVFVKRRETFEERKVLTATRKSNQIKNLLLLLLLSSEKEKNRKERRRDPHLFSFFTRRDCGWVWGEEGISFRFERASSKLLLLENSVNFDDVSKAMTSPLSFALSPPQKKTKKMCGCSLSAKNEKKKKHKINFTRLSSFLQITADGSRGYLLSLRQIPQIRGHQGSDRSWPGWRVRSVPGRSRHPRLLQGH